MEQTLGQKIVGADFNPDKNDFIDVIKNKSAELIDLIQCYVNDEADRVGNETYEEFIKSNKVRSARVAQQHVETACLFAVKANFIK